MTSREAVIHPVFIAFAAGCVAAPQQPDAALLEAVDWYTGVAGAVADDRARALLDEAVAGDGPLAVMWLARVHSTGRMGFPRDGERAREWYRRAAAAGNREARDALERLEG